MITSEPEQKSKRPLQSTGWDVLGAVCVAVSMMMFMLTPEKSLMHRIGVVVLGIGAVCRSLRGYMLIPCVLLLTASILGAVFGYMGSLRVPILTLSAFAVAIFVYGWWKERQAKIVAKRQNYRP